MTTAADTRALDAAYRPFPPFADWQARTSVESPRWSALVTRLKEAKAAAATLTARALEVAKRAAAFDTGALENLYETDRGFTYSVAFQTGAWELGLLERGEQVRTLFQAQMNAYDLVLDFATGSEPISEAAIRHLHEVVCAAQDTYQVMTSVGPQNQPLPKGKYKVLPNHVRTRTGEDHAYAPADLTPAEMHRLTQELRSEAFLAAHPIQQAAYAHYCFVAIHPFADGNGRVARALASLYTYRAASAPIIILSEDKSKYLDALAEADGGNDQAFVSFLLNHSISTLGLVEDTLKDVGEPNYQRQLEKINFSFYSTSGLTPDEVNRRGIKLLHLFTDCLQTLLRDQPAFKASLITVSVSAPPAPPEGYRQLEDNHTLCVHAIVSGQYPNRGSYMSQICLYVPSGSKAEEAARLIPDHGTVIAVPLAELAEPNGFLRIRLQRRAEAFAAGLLARLTRLNSGD